MMGNDHQSNGPPRAPPQGQGSQLSAPPSSRADASVNSDKWLTVTDAMEYLDAVKLEYRTQPEIYDEFLAIMGRFKTKQILPPEVIVEVARLFRGRNSLVLRFNRFLPDGYKFGPSDIERLEDQYFVGEKVAARAARADTGGVPAGVVRRIRTGDPVHGTGANVEGLAHSIGEDRERERELNAVDEALVSERDDWDGEESGGTREFDHAIHYVTTIKRRFVTDPGTYKAFLDILHTYQREHRGINEVLEQVTGLFADQPDLLREFTYFLPDTVQAQAKERLDEAALEAEIRLGYRGQNGQLLERPWNNDGYLRGQDRFRDTNSPWNQGGSSGRHPQQQAHPLGGDSDYDEEWRREQVGYGYVRAGPHRSFHGMEYGPRPPYANGADTDRNGPRSLQPYPKDTPQRVPRNDRKGRQPWCHAEDYELGPDGVFKGPKKRIRQSEKQERQPGGWSSADSQGGIMKLSKEQRLFDQIRLALSSGGETNDWNEFLKCLELFNNRTFKRDHMLNSMQDLFEGHNEMDLMDQFKELVQRRGELEPPHRDAQTILGLSEINFQSAKKCTPSYRELPVEYQSALCSGRSADEEAVLNDTWVSVPVGSEDSNNFKHMRRNPHEEALFKTEDERFELDMLKDGVAATIARLEPVEEEIEALKATAGSATLSQGSLSMSMSGEKTARGSVEGSFPHFQYRLDRRTLGALHLSTVSRLYGEHGTEVLELMRKNPAVAIPVVLRRLRQKEREWIAAREEAKIGWKEIAQKNFHRSLDHRSYYFRREDKRVTSNRALLQEIKDKKVEEDPNEAAAVKAAREKVHDAHEDTVHGRISPASTAAEADSVSLGQGSGGEADAALDGAASDCGTKASPEASPENFGEKSGAGGRGPRSKEGIQLMRQQAEGSAPWYMFAHLTLVYPGDNVEEAASVHADIMELLSHTLARRPPSDEEVRYASAVVADLLPTFFAINKPQRNDANQGGAGVMSDARKRANDSLEEGLSMPVLSSDDDSDLDNLDNTQGSGDERQLRESSADSRALDAKPPSTKLDTLTKEPAKDAGGNGGGGADVALVESSHRLENQEVLFTTTDFYLALRMHHLLADRLAEAKRLCRDAKSSRQAVVASPHEILRESAGAGAGEGNEHQSARSGDGDNEGFGYKTFLGHLYDLLEDKTTTERYEEGVRQLVGNQGYVLCNLDRLVVGLLQNLYRAGADKMFHKLTQLYHYERAVQSQGVSPVIYKGHAQELMRRCEKEVVRAQYHPGTRGSCGWQVKPTLKMEYIGRMDTQQEGHTDESSESDGNAQADVAAVTME